MFCRKCGKELKEEWKKCPYCESWIEEKKVEANQEVELNREVESKAEVKSKAEVESKAEVKSKAEVNSEAEVNLEAEANPEAESNLKEETEGIQKSQAKFNFGLKISYKSIWKYIFLSMITCGIYGIYLLCCYAKDMNKICEGDGKESKSFIVVLLLGLVTCGIYTIYWWYVQAERLKEVASKYGVTIRESGSNIIIWYILGITIMPGIGIFVAIYLMIDNMNQIAFVYNGERTREDAAHMPKSHPHYIRNVLIIYAILLAIIIALAATVVIWFDSIFGDGESDYSDDICLEEDYEYEEDLPYDTELDETEDVAVDEPVIEETQISLYDIDMVDYVGFSIENLKEKGFQYDKEGNFYAAYNADVAVGVNKEGDTTQVVIEGNRKEMPMLYGVRIGASYRTTIDFVKNTYPWVQEYTDAVIGVNESYNEIIVYIYEEGKISRMYYACWLTDEEFRNMLDSYELLEEFEGTGGNVQETQLTDYIFPTSDIFYLTEEEVRSKTEEELWVGRNEIFARHGRQFDNPDLAYYFAGKSWYVGTIPGDSFDMEAILSDVEKANLILIQKIEDERGSMN